MRLLQVRVVRERSIMQNKSNVSVDVWLSTLR